MKAIIQSMKIGFLMLVLAAFATAASAQMTAQPSNNQLSIKDMVAQAELVFAGRVEKIQYALSEPTGPNGARIPHTFVTYRVEEVFAGEAHGNLVTLRFIGGLDPETMHYLSTSRTPLMDLGDQDILFVQGNTEKMCPLVSDFKGRLRVIKGQVYSETGRSILLDKKGSIKHGPRYRLDEVEKNTIGGRTLTMKKLGPKVKSLPSDAVGSATLKELVKKSAKEHKRKKAFVDADPFSVFAGPDLTPAPMPAVEAQ
jgi:hypothetical protein